MYLEFVEFEDYVAYLKQQSGAENPISHIEIGNTVGKMDSHGFQNVAYYAVLTRVFNGPNEIPFIATTAIPLMDTNNMYLQTELQKIKDTLHKRFDEVQEKVSRKLQLTRGKWRLDAPYYHK